MSCKIPVEVKEKVPAYVENVDYGAMIYNAVFLCEFRLCMHLLYITYL
jgi:hypothetical protein